MGHDCEGRGAGEAEIKSQIFRRTDSRLFAIALLLVQYAAEIKKPDGERLAQFHDANLQSLKFQMLSPAPISTATEKLYMKTALNLAKEKLGIGRPICAGGAEWRQRGCDGGFVDGWNKAGRCGCTARR